MLIEANDYYQTERSESKKGTIMRKYNYIVKATAFVLTTSLLSGIIPMGENATSKGQIQKLIDNTVTAKADDTSNSSTAEIRNVNLNVNGKIAGIHDPEPAVDADAQWSNGKGSYVYFGDYFQTADGTTKQPIKWCVLDSDGNDGNGNNSLFLISDRCLDAVRYNETERGPDNEYITYTNSNIRKFLNSSSDFVESTDYDDYTKGGFYDNAFNTVEKTNVCKTNKVDENEINYTGAMYYSRELYYKNAKVEGDYVFLPSVDELSKSKLGFYDDEYNPTTGAIARYRKGTEYLKSLDCRRDDKYWLRSTDNIYYQPAVASLVCGTLPRVERWCIRPETNIKRDTIAFAYKSDKAKTSELTQTTKVSDDAHTWKLTYTDGSGFNATAQSDTSCVEAGENVKIHIKKIPTLTDGNAYTQVSAMIVDKNNTVVAYGKIKEKPEVGYTNVTIPEGLSAGDYTIKVFAEDVNSTAESPEVDYASNMSSIPVKVVTPNVTYRVQVQKKGWETEYVAAGQTSGTVGEALRLEAIKIKLINGDGTAFDTANGGIEYRVHVQKKGWEKEYLANDGLSGTVGEGLRLEAIQIKLTGDIANKYDVYYRVQAQKFGWLGWAMNGAKAGTEGYAYRLEGIQIKLLSKGSDAPTESGGVKDTNLPCFFDKNKIPEVSYKTQVQTYGWQGYVSDGKTSGTVGKAKRLEAIMIKISNNKGVSGSIQYKTHIQKKGWEAEYRTNNALSGTVGKALRLEAIQIKLTGNLAENFDIYYRVQAQHFGWMGWAKNGESSGTSGYGYRLEAIQIQLAHKGTPSNAIGSTGNAYRSK